MFVMRSLRVSILVSDFQALIQQTKQDVAAHCFVVDCLSTHSLAALIRQDCSVRLWICSLVEMFCVYKGQNIYIAKEEIHTGKIE